MKSKIIDCDVLVVGAGISGISAALAAAACNAKTVLIEKDSLPGGIPLDCRHRYLCGLYPRNSGIAGKILQTLQKLNPANRFMRLGKLPVFRYRPQDLRPALRRILKKEKNLKIFYNCPAEKVEMKKGRIIYVKAQKSRFTFLPKNVIDATGSGVIIKLSKAGHKLSPLKSRQLAGFTFEVSGLKGAAGLLPIKIPYCLSLAVKQKKLPAHFKFTNFTYGPDKNCGTVKLNLPAGNKPRGATVAKKYARLIHNYLSSHIVEFKNSRIRHIASEIHEREGLRLAGQYTLTEQDVLGGKKFANPAARGFWPIEFWHPQAGQQITYLKKNYQIPLDCLKSKNVANLFAVGKCISATPRALASSRVTGTCIYLGETAGKAAAK